MLTCHRALKLGVFCEVAVSGKGPLLGQFYPSDSVWFEFALSSPSPLWLRLNFQTICWQIENAWRFPKTTWLFSWELRAAPRCAGMNGSLVFLVWRQPWRMKRYSSDQSASYSVASIKKSNEKLPSGPKPSLTDRIVENPANRPPASVRHLRTLRLLNCHDEKPSPISSHL